MADVLRPIDSGTFEGAAVSTRLKIAGLWVSAMLLYVYVDIVGFYTPGTIDEIRAGRVWEFAISQTWAFSALLLMAIPSLMVALTLVLPPRVARWANLVVAGLFVPVTLGNLAGETWLFYWLGAALEMVLLVGILRLAWRWRP